jgi:hypothetical protein
MDVVGAFACSHAGFLISHYERAEQTTRERVYAGFARMRDTIKRLEPDALVVIATDHGRIYPLNHQPQYVIGVGSPARGIGDSGLPECEVPVHQEYATLVLEGCIERGVDLAYSEAVSIDHSFVTPLMLSRSFRTRACRQCQRWSVATRLVVSLARCSARGRQAESW